jgi:hypothetical protein
MERDNDQWQIPPDADTALRTDDPEAGTKARYRLAVYRFAQIRLKEELRIGTPRAIAVWTAGRAAGEHYDLEPAAWALLIHALLISVAD